MVTAWGFPKEFFFLRRRVTVSNSQSTLAFRVAVTMHSEILNYFTKRHTQTGG